MTLIVEKRNSEVFLRPRFTIDLQKNHLEALRNRSMEIAEAMDEVESMPEFMVEFNNLMAIAREIYEYRIQTEGRES